MLQNISRLRRSERRQSGDGDPVSPSRLTMSCENRLMRQCQFCQESSAREDGHFELTQPSRSYRRLASKSIATVDTHFGSPRLFLHQRNRGYRTWRLPHSRVSPRTSHGGDERVKFRLMARVRLRLVHNSQRWFAPFIMTHVGPSQTMATIA